MESMKYASDNFERDYVKKQTTLCQGGRKPKPSREHGNKGCMFNARKKEKCIEPKRSSLERRSRAPVFLPPWGFKRKTGEHNVPLNFFLNRENKDETTSFKA